MGFTNHGLITLLILVLTALMITGEDASFSLVIEPHCSSKCGDVTIPYPFGIGEGCQYIDHDNPDSYPIMNITCNQTVNPHMPILGKNIQILGISLEDGEIRLNTFIAFDCDFHNDTSSVESNLNAGTFTISSTKNKFVATGCDTKAWFSGTRYNEPYATGCMTWCNKTNNIVDNKCNGVGCCETQIPDGVTNLHTNVSSFENHRGAGSNPCSAAYAVATDAFMFSKENLTHGPEFYSNSLKVPSIFNWGIGTKNCSEAKNSASFLCKSNTNCIDLAPDLDGYRCNCTEGFTGNPYLPQGCKDVNECNGENDCEKPEFCENNDGSYVCKCPNGYHGNATKASPCISSAKTWVVPVTITAGVGGGIIVMLIVGFLWHHRRGQRKLDELRQSYFRENGGLILHEKASRLEVIKIFTAKELENATDKFSDAKIVGRGGYGVVYRGILPDNQQVAIKRSLKVDPDQVEQFINEVLVLSQINNRHVVKLLGCCLETEVPLLVYEFINNGTLYDHLHEEGKASHLTWGIRLRIASEIAGVLSYLHTTISTPIIHRDMKSMNILLDESCTAKVADFGASRLVPEDQGQLATMVLGTLGYLDPEYMQTSELTEKSDVYSFGVVMVELLTKEKAISYQRPEVERCLTNYFLVKMKEDRLFEIVDNTMLNDQEEVAQIKEVANLAKWCLMLKGEQRPTMKEVAMGLEGIKRMASCQKQNDRKSTGRHENYGEHLIGIPIDDEANSIGKDSDLYSIPLLAPVLGDGR